MACSWPVALLPLHRSVLTPRLLLLELGGEAALYSKLDPVCQELSGSCCSVLPGAQTEASPCSHDSPARGTGRRLGPRATSETGLDAGSPHFQPTLRSTEAPSTAPGLHGLRRQGHSRGCQPHQPLMFQCAGRLSGFLSGSSLGVVVNMELKPRGDKTNTSPPLIPSWFPRLHSELTGIQHNGSLHLNFF